jgi:hypothetical protein
VIRPGLGLIVPDVLAGRQRPISRICGSQGELDHPAEAVHCLNGFGGRRYLLVFILAVAVACVIARAKNVREIGGQAADLPQEVRRRLGGTRHPLRRSILAPRQKPIRTLVPAIGADALDDLIGGWLRALADAGAWITW